MTGVEVPLWLVLLMLAGFYTLLGLRWDPTRHRLRQRYQRYLANRSFNLRSVDGIFEKENGEG